MLTTLTNAQAAWVAYENEVQAGRWARGVLAEHIRRIEDELSAEADARQRAEHRAHRLEEDLRAAGKDPATPVSGVRLRGQPA